ncbi:MAG: hypothetical protein ACR2QM_02815 [Longimicrobiales bacterium]
MRCIASVLVLGAAVGKVAQDLKVLVPAAMGLARSSFIFCHIDGRAPIGRANLTGFVLLRHEKVGLGLAGFLRRADTRATGGGVIQKPRLDREWKPLRPRWTAAIPG